MHPIELKVVAFMQKVASQSLDVTVDALKPAAKDVDYYLKKMYEDDPNRPFVYRLSSIGKPLCILQMEKAKAKRSDPEWNLPLRFMFGGIIEGLAVSILRHAGVNIEEEQTPVTYKVGLPEESGEDIYEIPGTLDLVIDGKVWDVKSASPYSYENKFASYETLRDEDAFGYLPQLYGYSHARGLPPGGWIVIDKSSGMLKVIPVPDDYHADMDIAMGKIDNNFLALYYNHPFKRCFNAKDETFKKRYTGNKYLDFVCSMCPAKNSCWPGLQYLPIQESTAKNKSYRYYTELGKKSLKNENAVSESQGQTPTTTSDEGNTEDVSAA